MTYPVPTIADGRKVMARYRRAFDLWQSGTEFIEISHITGFEVVELEHWAATQWSGMHDRQAATHALEKIKLSADRIVGVTNKVLSIIDAEVDKLLRDVDGTEERVVAVRDMKGLIASVQALYAMLDTKQDKDHEFDRQKDAIKNAVNLNDPVEFLKMMKTIDPDMDGEAVIRALQDDDAN